MPVTLKGAFDILQDIRGFCGPDEGFRLVVMLVDVGVDRRDQFFDIAKHAAPESMFGQIAEEALQHVQPGSAGGREVQWNRGHFASQRCTLACLCVA